MKKKNLINLVESTKILYFKHLYKFGDNVLKRNRCFLKFRKSINFKGHLSVQSLKVNYKNWGLGDFH